MPNKGKGGINHHIGKNEKGFKRELIFCGDGQENAQVTRILGNGCLLAMHLDVVKRLCPIRYMLRKNVWIARSDLVWAGLRDYQNCKDDVILKYFPNKARNLNSNGECPKCVRVKRQSPLAKDMKENLTKFRPKRKVKMILLVLYSDV